jgi:hypothetical protein
MGKLVMSSAKEPLPSQARARSLERLDDEIVRAEMARSRWLARVRQLEAAGQNTSYGLGLLGIAEQRLAQLDRSREVLLHGEEGREDDGPEHQA